MFLQALGAYLVGWLLVNLIFNRLLAAATKNQERLDKLKVKGHQEFAAAVVDEMLTAGHELWPYKDGDALVLGPEIFVSADREVICWRGENYVLQ